MSIRWTNAVGPASPSGQDLLGNPSPQAGIDEDTWSQPDSAALAQDQSGVGLPAPPQCGSQVPLGALLVVVRPH
jgi:hypothetical protein